MKRGLLLATCLIVVTTFSVSPPAVAAGTGGTVQGTVTTQGGQLLNGVCGHLLNVTYTTDVTDFAGTGTTGQAGFYTQANVPAGRYILLFTDCGANVGGGPPNPNYVPVFYGGTDIPNSAIRFSVSNNQTTSLGPTPMVLGGTVSGKVTDTTTKKGADTIAVAAVFPNDAKFNVTSPFSWQIVCSDSGGNYSVSGVPNTGVRIYFAPNTWGCFNSQGTYNGGFWVQKASPLEQPPVDGTLAHVNGSVKESSPPSTMTASRTPAASGEPGGSPVHMPSPDGR